MPRVNTVKSNSEYESTQRNILTHIPHAALAFTYLVTVCMGRCSESNLKKDRIIMCTSSPIFKLPFLFFVVLAAVQFLFFKLHWHLSQRTIGH